MFIQTHVCGGVVCGQAVREPSNKVKVVVCVCVCVDLVLGQRLV